MFAVGIDVPSSMAAGHPVASGTGKRDRASGVVARPDGAPITTSRDGAREATSPLPSPAVFQDQDLRDTAVTWLSLAERTKFQISAITGHSLKSIDEILKHYFGPHPDLAREAIGNLEKWFGGQA